MIHSLLFSSNLLICRSYCMLSLTITIVMITLSMVIIIVLNVCDDLDYHEMVWYQSMYFGDNYKLVTIEVIDLSDDGLTHVIHKKIITISSLTIIGLIISFLIIVLVTIIMILHFLLVIICSDVVIIIVDHLSITIIISQLDSL